MEVNFVFGYDGFDLPHEVIIQYPVKSTHSTDNVGSSKGGE